MNPPLTPPRRGTERAPTEACSQAHLPENELQHVVQTDDPQLPLVATEHDGQAISTPLHPPQSFLQTHLRGQIQSRLDVVAGGFARVKVALIKQRLQAEHADNPPPATFLPPDGEAGPGAVAAGPEGPRHGRARRPRAPPC